VAQTVTLVNCDGTEVEMSVKDAVIAELKMEGVIKGGRPPYDPSYDVEATTIDEQTVSMIETDQENVVDATPPTPDLDNILTEF